MYIQIFNTNAIIILRTAVFENDHPYLSQKTWFCTTVKKEQTFCWYYYITVLPIFMQHGCNTFLNNVDKVNILNIFSDNKKTTSEIVNVYPRDFFYNTLYILHSLPEKYTDIFKFHSNGLKPKQHMRFATTHFRLINNCSMSPGLKWIFKKKTQQIDTWIRDIWKRKL